MSTLVTLHTNHGAIQLELNEKKAPKTVNNFLSYAKAGFYDGTIFHRVIDQFMIQGGGFLPGMSQKKGHDPIENEADNGLKNVLGSIAMARTSDPHSASSQFFINVKDNAFLDFQNKTPHGWGYCVFGQVTQGLEILDTIKKAKTGSRAGHQDVPLEDILIERVDIG